MPAQAGSDCSCRRLCLPHEVQPRVLPEPHQVALAVAEVGGEPHLGHLDLVACPRSAVVLDRRQRLVDVVDLQRDDRRRHHVAPRGHPSTDVARLGRHALVVRRTRRDACVVHLGYRHQVPAEDLSIEVVGAIGVVERDLEVHHARSHVVLQLSSPGAPAERGRAYAAGQTGRRGQSRPRARSGSSTTKTSRVSLATYPTSTLMPASLSFVAISAR